MRTRSERHHEVPQWLLKHFCWDHGNMLWMEFKDTREIRPVSLRDAFVRKDANTRTDYQSRGDGTFQQVKSDLDENSFLLAKPARWESGWLQTSDNPH